MRILFKTIQNQAPMYIIDKNPHITYEYDDSTHIIGRDQTGTFISQYTYRREMGSKAFAGSTIHLDMADGDKVDLKDTWWDFGTDVAQSKYGKAERCSYLSIDKAVGSRRCFTAYHGVAVISKIEKILRMDTPIECTTSELLEILKDKKYDVYRK